MARLEAERLEFKEAKSTLDPPRTLTSIAPACAAPPCQTTAVPASSASQKLTTDPGPGKATVTRPSAASATWQPLFSGWSTLTACTRRALKRQDAALPKEQTAQLARISHKPIVGSPVWSPAGVVRTGFAPFFWLAPCEGEASAVPRPSVALAGRSGPATDGFRPNSAHTAPLRRSAAPRLSALRRLSAA
jgi:hypothetical protein